MSETEMTTIPSVKLVGDHLMATIGGHTKIFKVDATQLLIDLEAAHATATAKIERLRGLLADVMESSLGMTQGAIGRVQSFQDAEAFLTTLEPKDGEL